MVHWVEEQSCQLAGRRLMRSHHQHPFHRMVGESDLRWMHLAKLSGLELVLVQQLLAYYSQKLLLQRSYRVLGQLT
jgi:hypothetical protein